MVVYSVLTITAYTTAITLKSNRNVWLRKRHHFLRLIKLPGLNNQEIGETFVSLIDEAFKNYRLFQESEDYLSYGDWTKQFNLKIQVFVNQGIEQAGGTASKLLRSLIDKARGYGGFFSTIRKYLQIII